MQILVGRYGQHMRQRYEKSSPVSILCTVAGRQTSLRDHHAAVAAHSLLPVSNLSRDTRVRSSYPNSVLRVIALWFRLSASASHFNIANV